MDTQDAVLRRLMKEPGAFVSGQELAADLGVSRNAVWKAVEGLRERGWEIEAKPRRGYRLLSAPDVPDEASVLPGLQALETDDAGRATGPLFRRVVYVPETGSTNDAAKRQARAGAPEGTVVTTDFQTGGRGRRGRSWVSPPGAALAFSVVLRPPIHPRQAPLLAFLAAAAVREAVAEVLASRAEAADGERVQDRQAESLVLTSGGEATVAVPSRGDVPKAGGARIASGEEPPGLVRTTAGSVGVSVPGGAPETRRRPEVLVKWPNDVVVDDRKLCGVLVEMSAEPERVHWCVVGVGVNVNQTAEQFPPELRDQAVSLRMAAGKPVRRVPLLQRILAGMARRYRHVLQRGFGDLLAETRRRSATIGRDVRICEADGTWWDGYALDIRDDGSLLVRPASRPGTDGSREPAPATAGTVAKPDCPAVPSAYGSAQVVDREEGVVAVYAADVSVRSRKDDPIER